jgi:cell division protein FtsL
VGACLFLVWVRVAQVDAGYKIHDLRDEELRLRHDKSALTLERASLMRPERLARIAQTELNLVPPDPTRAVQVVATTSPTPAASLEVKP